MIQDTTILDLITKESNRQETTLNLIASENNCSIEVMRASASPLTNKYAEGYPGKRYYAGCEVIDEVEKIAIERCKKLFNAEHANVQPHAGSQANLAAYFAVLKPDDTILGMSLAEGGHLTHGHPVNFSGTVYNVVQYKVHPETHQLDFDEIEALALAHKPKLIICGASAYSRTVDFEKFSAIAKKVGALLMADIAHIAGLIAAGLHPSPFPHADIATSTTHKTLRGPRGAIIMCKKELAEKIDKAVMPGTQGGPFMNVIAAKAVAFHEALDPSFKEYQKQVIVNAQTLAQSLQEKGYDIVAGGTDNHLFIVDLRSKNVSGRAAEIALANVGITCSRSCIPFDTAKPWVTSGVRFGTPSLSTRGMKETEMKQVADLVDRAIMHREDADALADISQEVKALCELFPIYK